MAEESKEKQDHGDRKRGQKKCVELVKRIILRVAREEQISLLHVRGEIGRKESPAKVQWPRALRRSKMLLNDRAVSAVWLA